MRIAVFNLTRWRLAAWYAGVMGVILGICGLAIYEVMDRVHWHALHQELQLVSGTLHDSLEPKLVRAGTLEPSVEQALPGLCKTGQNCLETSGDRHLLGVVQQAGYYVRLLDLSGQRIATLGYQPVEISGTPQELWQTLKTQDGKRYHQISLRLKTQSGREWGYLQVGRSLADFDDHLISLKLVILLGLPVALLLITAASWWLSGLAMRPMYRSYQQIQQFTADAAHELRTPLSAIKATIEAALGLSPWSETESLSTLRTLERQTNRLSQLVQDLLLLSRMDSQAPGAKHQPCCFNDVISDVVEEYAAMAIAASLTLASDIHPQQALFVLGDEAMLYQLLANLVTNAIQHTPAGGTVTVRLTQEAHQAILSVIDTGVGIVETEQPHIFDRFYRVMGDRSRQTGGAGLGLAIAQAIAQAHSTMIEVNSELDRGSQFVMRFPLVCKDK